MSDYYETLGVNRKATLKQIKSAYRDIAKNNHPDKFPGDKKKERRFIKAAEAYAILSDTNARREYDLKGSVSDKTKQRVYRPGSGIDSIMKDFNNRERKKYDFPSHTQYGFDDSNIPSLDEIMNIIGDEPEQPEQSTSSGWLDKIKNVVSHVIDNKRVPYARSAHRATFHGLEYHIEDNGDVYLQNIIGVAFPDAVLGTQVKVLTIDAANEGYTLKKELDVRVPPGLSSQKTLRLRKQGIGGGDLYITLEPVAPKKLSNAEIELYEQLRALSKKRKT